MVDNYEIKLSAFKSSNVFPMIKYIQSYTLNQKK